MKPGKLLAGEYPGSWREGETRRRLRRLLETGVTFFLDLTEAGEYGLRPYAPLLLQEAEAMGREVEHRRMPIRDRSTPTPGEMARTLDAIDGALEAGHVVYVHCYAGIGRTGTTVGCYLARHGMSGEGALAEIARLRQEISARWQRSPETSAQREMVRDYRVPL